MNTRINALIIMVAVACWVSCKKNNDAPQTHSTTSVNFVNASTKTINFYLNGIRINNSTSYFPGGTLGYVNVTAGLQNYQVKLAGAANPNALFTLPLTLDSGKVYSLFITGQTAGDVIFRQDTLIADTSNIAKVRFVNASPDGGPLVFVFGKNGVADTVKVDKMEYKKITPFIGVKGGVHNLAIYNASAPLNRQLDTLSLSRGRVYTIYSYGTVGSAGAQALSTSLIVNQ